MNPFGCGDLRPTRGLDSFIVIFIALLGLITSGILVAIALEAELSHLPSVAAAKPHLLWRDVYRSLIRLRKETPLILDGEADW